MSRWSEYAARLVVDTPSREQLGYAVEVPLLQSEQEDELGEQLH